MTLILSTLLLACGGSTTPPTDTGTVRSGDPAPKAEKAKEGDHAGHDGHEKKDMGEMAKPAEGAKVMFTSPEDGAKLKSPVKIVMGVEGMEVQPAGELKEGTGHHHLIIDSDPVGFGEAVPADEKHIHFGKGQTEAEVELAPGEHTIQMQFADGAHRSYGEQMTAKITVTIEE